MLSPIALFAYKRADHLRRTLESLQANAEASGSRLYVFCDGAKGDSDRPGVDAVRALVAKITGFASVSVTCSETNLGLARSIVQGVSAVLREHERVIVLEDDLILSPHFLRFMNDALTCYAEDTIVASIHGYVYPVAETLPETFFLRGADCWGWATWRRAWRHYNHDGSALLGRLRESRLERAFDMGGSYGFSRMLADQVSGRNDSWAIRWHASCFLDGMLTLYPGRSLVENIGNDASGMHCGATGAFAPRLSERPVGVERMALSESAAAQAAFVHFFRSQKRLGLLARSRHWIARKLGGRE